MLNFSKSKYCDFWQCPKITWLKKYKPDVVITNDSIESNMAIGNEIGDLAMGLFGNYTEVTLYKGGCLDISAMIEKTKAEIEKGTAVITEAAFDYNGLYCAVDILKKEDNGWSIYEVKSSTGVKDVYIADVAYQKYVLENCGLNIVGTYLVNINNQYIFDGTLDIQQLFKINDVSEAVAVEAERLPGMIRYAEQIMSSADEPDIDLSEGCNSPYPCACWEYCSRHLPKPSVFDLYRMGYAKKVDYYKSGKAAFEQLVGDVGIKNDKQKRQIDFALNDKGTFIDKVKIRQFLDKLSYPLYFLDFETMQMPIPAYIGTKPYDQIPFQYSLHYIETADGELKHKEFLAESGPDPRRALAERLCTDIPMNVCVTAYNKSFECGRIKELANAFPDLSEHLLNIESNIVDLLVPFQNGYYYNRAMGGSFSIKSVLPAIFPDDPSLDYHNLEGVHNGSEAMTIFPKIKDMNPDEAEQARNNLLEYCKLDTYAMVKVWEELESVTN